MARGLESAGISAAVAHQVASMPPISVLFAAFLGYNPLQTLIPPSAAHALSTHAQHLVFGTQFFPELIAPAVQDGLHIAFYVAAILSLLASCTSLLRGKRYISSE
jgi:hypothetical protein